MNNILYGNCYSFDNIIQDCSGPVQIYDNNGKTYYKGVYTGDEIREDLFLINVIDYKKVIFTESFLREFSDNINWYDMTNKQKVSLDFLREFKDELDKNFWKWTLTTFELTDKFIDEFKDYLDWNEISRLLLKEDFIIKYIDKLNWNLIQYFREVSEEFLETFKEKVNWRSVISTKELSEDFLLKMKEYIEQFESWETISIWQNLSEKFMKKNGIRSIYRFLYEQNHNLVITGRLNDDYYEPKLIQ